MSRAPHSSFPPSSYFFYNPPVPRTFLSPMKTAAKMLPNDGRNHHHQRRHHQELTPSAAAAAAAANPNPTQTAATTAATTARHVVEFS